MATLEQYAWNNAQRAIKRANARPFERRNAERELNAYFAAIERKTFAAMMYRERHGESFAPSAKDNMRPRAA